MELAPWPFAGRARTYANSKGLSSYLRYLATPVGSGRELKAPVVKRITSETARQYRISQEAGHFGWQLLLQASP